MNGVVQLGDRWHCKTMVAGKKSKLKCNRDGIDSPSLEGDDDHVVIKSIEYRMDRFGFKR